LLGGQRDLTSEVLLTAEVDMPQILVLAESIAGGDRAIHGIVLTGDNPRHLGAHVIDARDRLAASTT
jgi:hypothetical protein